MDAPRQGQVGEVAFRRVIRSDDLPLPRRGRPAATVREQALAETLGVPTFHRVEIGGEAVLLTRLPSGQPVAFAAHCPHQGTPLRHASLYEGNIRCPQHNYVYDPHTGRNLVPSRDARPEALHRLKPGVLAVYPVEERDGWVWVGDQRKPPPTDPASPPPAPSPTAKPPPADDVPVEHRPRSLTVVAGEELEVHLPTRPRPGHLWRVEVVEGDAVEVGTQRFDRRGQRLVYHISLLARHAGRARVRCTYATPWGRTPSETARFEVHVEEPGERGPAAGEAADD